MADRPQRESGEQSRTGHRFKHENGDVNADEYSSEPSHKKPNRVYLLSHEGHEGSQRTQCCGNFRYHKETELAHREQQDFLDFAGKSEFPAFLRHLVAEAFRVCSCWPNR